MYETLHESSGRVLGCEVSGNVTEAEMTEIAEDIDRVAAEEGAVRLLVYVPDLPAVDLDAIDDDIGIWLDHSDDIERCAVVGDSQVMEWGLRAEDRVLDVEMEHFDEDELDEAWAWIRE